MRNFPLVFEVVKRQDKKCEPQLSQKLNEKLPAHRKHISHSKERVRRKLFAQLRGWLSQVDGDENGEGNKEILIEHLIVSDCFVVVVENGYGGELGHGEEDHHTKAMEVGAQSSSTDPQAVYYCLQGF